MCPGDIKDGSLLVSGEDQGRLLRGGDVGRKTRNSPGGQTGRGSPQKKTLMCKRSPFPNRLEVPRWGGVRMCLSLQTLSF